MTTFQGCFPKFADWLYHHIILVNWVTSILFVVEVSSRKAWKRDRWHVPGDHFLLRLRYDEAAQEDNRGRAEEEVRSFFEFGQKGKKKRHNNSIRAGKGLREAGVTGGSLSSVLRLIANFGGPCLTIRNKRAREFYLVVSEHGGRSRYKKKRWNGSDWTPWTESVMQMQTRTRSRRGLSVQARNEPG